EQRGGDQEGLGLGGVLDLLGVGLGAQVDKVDAAEGGPPPQARFGARQREPGSEEAGLLGALAGCDNSKHVYDCYGYRWVECVPPDTNLDDWCCRYPTKDRSASCE